MVFAQPAVNESARKDWKKCPIPPVASTVNLRQIDILKIYLPTIMVILVDQLSKIWIKNNFSLWESREILGSFIKFSHVKNQGIAFGISVGELGIVVTILSFIATLLVAYVHWQERFNHPLIVIGLALILGGAIGNFIDRSTIFFSEHYEGVVDFIDVGIGTSRWYTFNIADSAITVGIVLYLLHSLFMYKPELIEQLD